MKEPLTNKIISKAVNEKPEMTLKEDMEASEVRYRMWKKKNLSQ